MAGVTPVNQPLERISIDLTELGSGSLSHKYILSVMDHFSRFVNLFPMATRTADSVVKKIRDGGGGVWSPQSTTSRQREGVQVRQAKRMVEREWDKTSTFHAISSPRERHCRKDAWHHEVFTDYTVSPLNGLCISKSAREY